MGIGLLSMPYAMRQGGWLGMGALAIATAVFCLSGKLIVRNFDKLPPDASHTYPALGARRMHARFPAMHAIVCLPPLHACGLLITFAGTCHVS